MIVLHHCVGARSFRVLWTLEELQVPYQLVMLPFPPRVHVPQYLEINPAGTVPTLHDGDIRMTESVAICQYLAERHGGRALTVASDDPAYAPYLNYLSFGEATLTFPQTLILRYGRYESPERRSGQVVEDYTRWFLARLKTVDSFLHDRTFLCGDRFTLADISVGYALLLADYLELSPSFRPSTQEYWTRLRTREAFRRALAVEKGAATRQGISTTPAPLMGLKLHQARAVVRLAYPTR